MPETYVHTPGPWTVTALTKRGGRWDVYGPDVSLVCQVNVARSGDERLANARLIAAAPEAYDLLKGMDDYIRDAGGTLVIGAETMLHRQIQAWLAKVTGQ